MNVVRRTLLLSIAATLVVAGVAPGEALAGHNHPRRDFSGLYVFGDSLSDTGNTYFLRGEINQPPWEVIPELPYESRRFSNGKLWVEIVAEETRNYRGALPAYRGKWFGNYAVAGARIQGIGAGKPSFGDQVQRYLGTAHGRANPDALYVVQFGANDIRDALETALGGGDPITDIGGAIQALAYNISLLSEAGARRFLIANAPNLGKVPAVAALGAQGPAEQLSSAYNLALDGVLMQLAAAGLEIYRVDFFSFVDAATEIPQGLGFSDAMTPCLQVFEPPATGVCEDPDQHLFWDGIHPTRAGHRLVGSIAVNALSLR